MAAGVLMTSRFVYFSSFYFLSWMNRSIKLFNFRIFYFFNLENDFVRIGIMCIKIMSRFVLKVDDLLSFFVTLNKNAW